VDTVINVEHLYKEYKLGVISHGTLIQDFQSWWAKMRGKEDPNSLLSMYHTRSAEAENIFALNDISFQINQGDRIGIIGKNGAGKSTLLKILSRITSPTKGNIRIKGRVGSLLEVGTGFHAEMTGRENIYLNGAILGMKRREISRRLDEIIAFAGIEKYADTPVKRYSSGMYVRLGFAVAAHLDTDILIADEVLAVGDAEFQEKALGKMQEMSTGEGRTILFVSHNLGAVRVLCNRGLILEKGAVKVFYNDIDYTIKTYLKNDDKKIFSEWHNNSNEFTSPLFRPIDFYLTDENGKIITGSIKNNSECWVNIIGEIKEEDNTLVVGYALYNSDGLLLYWTVHTDENRQKWPRMAAGICKLKSRIPERLLNEDDYRLELISGLNNRLWILQPGISTPTIHLSIKGGLSDSPYFYQRRPGILAPIIHWK
jgi:lipopolysaccharide transport system ATP-binding protein